MKIPGLNPEKIGGINKISFGIIPKNKGYFVVFFNSSHILSESVEFVNKHCSEYIEVKFKTNTGIDNNFGLYKANSPDINVTFEGFNQEGGYAFVVVE